MGSRVHESLEALYTSLRFCKPMSTEALIALYHKKWDTEWHENVQIVREGMTPDEYRALGERCLIEYDRRYRPFDQDRTLGLEYPVTFSLDAAGKYRMQGYIDRLSRPADGVIWIHDYKTRGFFPSQQDINEDRQLAYYQMAVEKLWPETREIELVWYYLIYDQVFRSRRTAEDLAALRIETLALIDEIESATAFPTRQSALCEWCAYRHLCPAFRHLYETTALAKNEYENEEGVVLVERLVALSCQAEADKRETENVKAALLTYAQKRGVETVFARGHKVRIKLYDHWHFPGRNDPGRAALEQAIKNAGKWESVSSLDGFMLDKALQNHAWEDAIVEQVRAFGTFQKNPWIKLFPRDAKR